MRNNNPYIVDCFYCVQFLGCGGNVTTPSGTILSKNYPNNYPHNTDCEWLITVDETHAVDFTFIDFDVEGASDCRYDYVAVCGYFVLSSIIIGFIMS